MILDELFPAWIQLNSELSWSDILFVLWLMTSVMMTTHDLTSHCGISIFRSCFRNKRMKNGPLSNDSRAQEGSNHTLVLISWLKSKHIIFRQVDISSIRQRSADTDRSMWWTRTQAKLKTSNMCVRWSLTTHLWLRRRLGHKSKTSDIALDSNTI